MLANPNKAASLARSSFGLANVLNRNKTHRAFMEKFLGIHHEKNLPDFASETFSKWADKEGHVNNSESDVHLFPTCFVENNQPEIGMDAIVVLNENGLKVSCSKGFECCGMPAWVQGDLKSLREMAKKNIDKLYPIAQEGKPVLVINPTCSMMIKDEYPRLLSEEYKEKAKTVSDSIADSCSILWDRRNEPGLKELKNIPEATIAYHAPCHQRAQSRGFRGRDVIRKLSGQKIKMVMECCGHDGTYGMKVETFEDSKRIGQKAFKAMQEAETEIWITDCPLAAMQFEQHAGVKAMHPLSFLAKCYKDG